MAGDKQTFTGRHRLNLKLTGPGSEKDTRHHEIALDGAPVHYLPGDALGVIPHNSPALVERILAVTGATGDEAVAGATAGTTMPLAQALTEIYNLNTPSRRLLELLVSRGATHLAPLLEKGNAEQLKHYFNGWNEAHDVLEVLEDHRHIRVTPQELIQNLRKMLPRLYSIASSLKAHPGQVDLLIVAVRYPIRGRHREGVCSTWFADRWPEPSPVPMYVQDQQKHFAMPDRPDVPIIMIGPGTGLAPFRAFIEERRVLDARGKNWLFFGEQRRGSDFFYEDQLTGYERDGFLRLDTAFSRDQTAKVYVQHRMLEQARDLWAWLEEGAEVFVCGDKERMAADVDRALHTIVETVGGRSAEQAREYVEEMRQTKRYKRDVY
jgi:sulfite reductase (NADPH) flavoprotein alpha-component